MNDWVRGGWTRLQGWLSLSFFVPVVVVVVESSGGFLLLKNDVCSFYFTLIMLVTAQARRGGGRGGTVYFIFLSQSSNSEQKNTILPSILIKEDTVQSPKNKVQPRSNIAPCEASSSRGVRTLEPFVLLIHFCAFSTSSPPYLNSWCLDVCTSIYW